MLNSKYNIIIISKSSEFFFKRNSPSPIKNKNIEKRISIGEMEL